VTTVRPRPEIRGLESYCGDIVYPTDRYEFAGKSVAVIGSGVEVARILPAVVDAAASVKVFQRTPAWVLPRANLPGARTITRIPRLAEAVGKVHLRLEIRDPWMRRQLTPGDGRQVIANSDYYRALRQPNCRLVTWPIARISPRGIRSAEGVEHRCDCIVLAGHSMIKRLGA
jgi:cation diffusion facilitator CzcD-associated flavoprotein CzcO